MQHAVDVHRRHGRALERREQHAAQRVAERQAEAALERLRHHGGGALGIVAERHFELVGLDEVLPILVDHGATFLKCEIGRGADRSNPRRYDEAPLSLDGAEQT